MKGIGCRHLKDIRMKKSVMKRGIVHCDCGTQEAHVPYRISAAISFDLVGVYFNDFGKGQKDDFLHLFCQLSQRLSMKPIPLIQGELELLPLCGGIDEENRL